MKSFRSLTLMVFVCLLVLGGCQGPQRRAEVVQLYQQGRYAEAIPLARDNLAKQETELGTDHPETASNLNLLALLYFSLGDYGRAEPLFQRALEIREKAYGEEHLDTATSLNNLGLLYDALGDFARAEPLYKRALAVREKLLGADRPDVAASLNNLAGLYYALGDYGQAVPLYQRAVKIWEKTLGEDHPELASSLNNLAGLYASLGAYDQAEPLYRRALKIREKSLGPEHPAVAESLNNLALLLQEQGDLVQAEPLNRRALAILEKVLGPEHPNVASALNNLAMLLQEKGDLAGAEEYSRQALAISERTLGGDHPDVAAGLENLAGLYAAQGDYQSAHQMFNKAQRIDDQVIAQVMGFTSEEKKLRFLTTRKSAMEGAVCLVAEHLRHDPAARRDALDIWLRRKGIILESQRRFQDALFQSEDAAVQQTFKELSDVRTELSQLAFTGPEPEDVGAYRAHVTALQGRKNDLEAKLSRMSRTFARQKEIERADSVKVARALPADSALIEFARIDMFDFQAGQDQDKWRPAHYLAFVLRSDAADAAPAMVDLGDAAAIDGMVTELKKAVMNYRDREGRQVQAVSRRLYDTIFAPLLDDLGPVRRLFISSDGNLNLIPFEILQAPDGRWLIEDYAVSYLSAGRDVLGFGRPADAQGPVVLMGDPNFNLAVERKKAVLDRLGLAAPKYDRVAVRAVDLRGINFSPLPGARDEVLAVQAMFRTGEAELFTGDEALEDVLKQKQSPRILHLATHGFFLSDVQLEALARTGRTGAGAKAGNVGPRNYNPLIRSGLALAGANRALAGGEGGGEGILTAEEVLGLPLRGSDLVVLSACETGLGEVRSGEGVYGLRRAFTQAGARGLLMSMWSVPDKETMDLMVEFYRNVNSGRLDRAQALRQAALKELDLLQASRGFAHPFFWGAFVYLGEP